MNLRCVGCILWMWCWLSSSLKFTSLEKQVDVGWGVDEDWAVVEPSVDVLLGAFDEAAAEFSEVEALCARLGSERYEDGDLLGEGGREVGVFVRRQGEWTGDCTCLPSI